MAPNNKWSDHRYRHQVFRDLPNDSDDVDDAIAAISAPPFDVPTTRIGTAGGFLRFGGGGGDRRWTFFAPLAVDMPLAALPAGLAGGGGGTRAFEVNMFE